MANFTKNTPKQELPATMEGLEGLRYLQRQNP